MQIHNNHVKNDATLIGVACRDHNAWLFCEREGNFFVCCQSVFARSNDENVAYFQWFLGITISLDIQAIIINNITLNELQRIINNHFKHTIWIEK